jgi:hypothetical protein
MAVRRSSVVWAEIKRLYLAGHGATQLSRQFLVSVDTIYKRSSKERWQDHVAVEIAPLAQDGTAELAAAIRQLAEVMAGKKSVMGEA